MRKADRRPRESNRNIPIDVLFVVPPFAEIRCPSIGVSLLKAKLVQLGFTSAIEYFNLDLAERIGSKLYFHLQGLKMVEGVVLRRGAEYKDDENQMEGPSSGTLENLLGEWFFAQAVFGAGLPEAQEYLTRFLVPDPFLRDVVPEILNARRQVGDYVRDCIERIRARKPRVVGFTTSFQQTCACLAIARGLKDGPDPPVIFFGGANCEGEMGLQLLRSFPWIDYLCSGEGDRTFPEFLVRLVRDGDDRPIPGILKQGESLHVSSPVPVQNMDSLPYPDYSDYFSKLRGSSIPRGDAWLPIETSRGCWWGAKQHCTFCGLNGETMTYRSKTPDRVFDELKHLKSYKIRRIECVDSILEMKYFGNLFPKLIANRLDVELFYETKANLKFWEVQMLRDAGVAGIQPGIESLSSHVLQLMRKGCTGLQNIQLLKWCDEVGIAVTWNFLIGFPGEDHSEYRRLAELIPWLTHLQPPSYCGSIRLDRFSPYFTASEKLGIANVRPMAPYGYIFPLEKQEIHSLAYFFDFDYADKRNPYTYSRALLHEVKRWGELTYETQQRPRLDLFEMDDLTIIKDTRPSAIRPLHILDGLDAQLYVQCDAVQTVEGLSRKFGADEFSVRQSLSRLRESKLLIEMEAHYLSLAVIRNRPSLFKTHTGVQFASAAEASSQRHLPTVPH